LVWGRGWGGVGVGGGGGGGGGGGSYRELIHSAGMPSLDEKGNFWNICVA